ncbi:WD-40 repeat protein [Reticulomyxa filosa]|uniref:WD-40 repeat protein n=1 Tax=Reticulomyxa filosa TaxID=46433 RepID=X6NDF7_RETFI|nr:WD-40 repeat protein [Reticulomyxa filosa]|eukprot:ETO23357.1 WD-40 repeat protein [Reticulomyxa filosa]
MLQDKIGKLFYILLFIVGFFCKIILTLGFKFHFAAFQNTKYLNAIFSYDNSDDAFSFSIFSYILQVSFIFQKFFNKLFFEIKQFKGLFILHHLAKGTEKMTTVSHERQALIQLELSEEEKIQIIIQYWIRRLNIKLGWIQEFDKLVVNYAAAIFMFDVFRSSSKLLKTFNEHTSFVNSIDCSTFDDCQFICSGSNDHKVRVWDLEANKSIQSTNGHSNQVYCVKFSPYHNHNNRRNVICSSSLDKTIRFWDIKDNQQFQIFNGHTDGIGGIELSQFSGGRYLCSASNDLTIRLWDVETSKSLHIFKGHTNYVWCVDMSPLQSNNNNDNNNNNNNNNNIGVIGGNGYTICSGSWDYTIRIWDIETAKQLNVFKGHEHAVWSVKYRSNVSGIIGGGNIILSGSWDKSVRLWDIRSGRQIRAFNGHTNYVTCVEYSPLVIKNIEFSGSSNVICSGSWDNTIRFWDIRSNKKELHVIKGDNQDCGILCLKFLRLKKKEKKSNEDSINLCYGSLKGPVRIWG